METYFAGMSLGMGADYSALALVEREGPAAPESEFRCRHLHRWQPGTPYAAVIEQTRAWFGRLSRPPQPPAPEPRLTTGKGGGWGRAVVSPLVPMELDALAKNAAAPHLALDVTGVGLPVAEMFKKGLDIPPFRPMAFDLDDDIPELPDPPRLFPVFITAGGCRRWTGTRRGYRSASW